MQHLRILPQTPLLISVTARISAVCSVTIRNAATFALQRYRASHQVPWLRITFADFRLTCSLRARRKLVTSARKSTLLTKLGQHEPGQWCYSSGDRTAAARCVLDVEELQRLSFFAL